MAVSYSLAPNPKWYIADLTGKPLGGGYLATFSSLNHTLFNPVYEDPAGQFPWPYVAIPNVGSLGILFDENGSQGPFYFAFDPSLPTQLYYLEVYDSRGVLQWTINDFTPGNGGGGGIVTTAINLENFVINNVFWRNIGSSPSPIGTTFLKLAPGANTGLIESASLAGPDICFFKNNTAATDTITFTTFTLGSDFLGNDINPVDYLNYSCTGSGAGETYKYVQIPITKGVQNLQNTEVTLTIWARGNSGTTTLTLSWLQFFGDGAAASPSVTTPVQTFTLNNLWQPFKVTATIPSVTGKSLGGCRNDGLFLQINYPLSVTCSIDFTKPSLYLGALSPISDYSTYDMINAVIDSPRTGDFRTSLNAFSPYGWVPCNDGTIGDPTSTGSTRANFDTFPLFDFLWNLSATYTPMYTNAGVPVARGATSIADYTAHDKISLTSMLGRVISGTTNTVIGTQTYTANTGISTTQLIVTDSTLYAPGTPVVLSNSGGAAPAGLIVSAVYYVIVVDATHIQLELVANSGIPISFSTNGTGINTIEVDAGPAGLIYGEQTHTLTTAEIPSHNHPPLGGAAGFDVRLAVGGDSNLSAGTQNRNDATTGSTGGDGSHNNNQPSIYLNVFLKL